MIEQRKYCKNVLARCVVPIGFVCGRGLSPRGTGSNDIVDFGNNGKYLGILELTNLLLSCLSIFVNIKPADMVIRLTFQYQFVKKLSRSFFSIILSKFFQFTAWPH